MSTCISCARFCRCSGCWRFSCRAPKKPDLHNSNCGSGLAREGGVSVDINVADTSPSRASPLPQGIAGVAYKSVRHKKAAYQTRLFLRRVAYTLKRKCITSPSLTM
ncbi:hypothetical protein C3E98_010545 [Pseudomonas sp. MWU13-2625]|nr:hypothetical protein C3E98_010545 [Pseudomonas sp. MWU13-2625]